MANVSINYNCGCGFGVGRLEEAVKHSDATGHTITVLGTIKPSSGVTEQKAKSDIHSRLDALRQI